MGEGEGVCWFWFCIIVAEMNVLSLKDRERESGRMEGREKRGQSGVNLEILILGKVQVLYYAFRKEAPCLFFPFTKITKVTQSTLHPLQICGLAITKSMCEAKHFRGVRA